MCPNDKIFIQSDLGHCISFPLVHMYLFFINSIKTPAVLIVFTKVYADNRCFILKYIS